MWSSVRRKIPLEPRDPTGAFRVPPFCSSLRASPRVPGRLRACVRVCARSRVLLWGRGGALRSWGEVEGLSERERVLAGAVSRAGGWQGRGAGLRPPWLEGVRSRGRRRSRLLLRRRAVTGWRLWRGRGGTCWKKPSRQV